MWINKKKRWARVYDTQWCIGGSRDLWTVRAVPRNAQKYPSTVLLEELSCTFLVGATRVIVSCSVCH